MAKSKASIARLCMEYRLQNIYKRVETALNLTSGAASGVPYQLLKSYDQTEELQISMKPRTG